MPDTLWDARCAPTRCRLGRAGCGIFIVVIHGIGGMRVVAIVSAGLDDLDELPLDCHSEDEVEVVDGLMVDLRNWRRVGGGPVVRVKVGD